MNGKLYWRVDVFTFTANRGHRLSAYMKSIPNKKKLKLSIRSVENNSCRFYSLLWILPWGSLSELGHTASPPASNAKKHKKSKKQSYGNK